MKRAILPVIYLLLAVKLIAQINSNTTGNTFYYFCVSHAKESGKQIVLYTAIYLAGDEKTIREKTKNWANLVDNGCENPGGCTSDLNYYTSKEQAEKELMNTKHLYRDSDLYTLKQVEFK